MQHLLETLPPKPVCDRLLEVYTKNFEKTFRIVHIPSLLRQYEVFWENLGPKSPNSLASFFMPLLVSILNVAAWFESPPAASEHSALWNKFKQVAPGLIQDWVQRLPRKETVELSSLQVQTLHLLSSQLRLVSVEEQWKTSGALVRSAMTMGLHANLFQATKLSFFQAEIRRRLWVTILEMDLQASIAAGMPTLIPDLNLDHLFPSNLNDEDFDESTLSLPLCKPLDENTDSSSQIVLATSLSQRIRAMKIAQYKSAHDSLTERLEQGRELEQVLHGIPSYLKPDPEVGSQDPSIVLQNVILDLYLRRPLLCLYRPVINDPPSNHDDPLFRELRRTCLESSLAILSYQDHFDPSISDFDTFNLSTYWNSFGTLFQNDILLSALSICKHMKLSKQHSAIQSPSKKAGSPAYDPMHSKARLINAVENTLATLTRRIGEKTCVIKDILLLSVVLHSVRARGTTEQKDRTISHGAKKALSACRQHLLTTAAEQSFELQLADLAKMVPIRKSDTCELADKSTDSVQ
ncbi:hypothetical protein N7523_003661 [Penicillium sp. IBT 18751x]|nr:hypothetical protein N7523_003661 [Penicillium sp. IBT 18751x]